MSVLYHGVMYLWHSSAVTIVTVEHGYMLLSAEQLTQRAILALEPRSTLVDGEREGLNAFGRLEMCHAKQVIIY